MKKIVGVVLIILSFAVPYAEVKAEYDPIFLIKVYVGVDSEIAQEILQKITDLGYIHVHGICENAADMGFTSGHVGPTGYWMDSVGMCQLRHGGLIGYLDRITNLDLSNKNIVHDRPDHVAFYFSFWGLPNVVNFDISHNEIARYSISRQDLQSDVRGANVKSMNISHNKLISFDIAQTSFMNVKDLDLSYNLLSEFKLNEGYLKNLSLNNNHLTSFTLSDSSNYCRDLETLTLNDNKLTSLDLTKCEKLKTLTVQNNNLSDLDVSSYKALSNLTADAKTFVKFVKFNSALKVNNSHQIEGVGLGRNVSSVKSLITKENSNYTITYKNKGNNLNDSDNVTTGTILRTSLGDTASEYKFIVLGDITGTGDVNVSDVARLYQYYKKKVDMESEFVQAGDVAKDGQIEINDVAKLYQFSKHNIDSL